MAATVTAFPLGQQQQQQQQHFQPAKGSRQSVRASVVSTAHATGTSSSAPTTSGGVATAHPVTITATNGSSASAFFDSLAIPDQQSPADDTPLSVHIKQLPTPRTSISSGANSPPEGLSPNSHSHSRSQSQSQSQSSHTLLQTPTHTRHQSSSQFHSASSFHTPSNSEHQSTLASTPSAHHSDGNEYNHNNINGASLFHARSPLITMHSPSPVPGSRPSLVHLDTTPASLLSTNSALQAGMSSATLGSSLFNVGGGGTGAGGIMAGGPGGGEVSSISTATSPLSNKLGGRAVFQNFHQHELESQQQQQHQQDQLEDERELQKKNARSAIQSVSVFLPPALNQSLTKVVQSAKDAVSPSSPHSKTSLPFGRHAGASSSSGLSDVGVGMGSISMGMGMGGGGVPVSSAYAPRSTATSLRQQLSRGSLMQVLKLPLICLSWYMSSAVTNNIGKQIMNQFRYPVTLTFVQFWFVSIFCYMAAGFSMTRIRPPTRGIIEMTAPLVGFQVVGHVFSSVAISRVPLSVVHTVKALTPLFTVLFYRVVLGTTYSKPTYMSLVPLTAGVMLACRMSLEFNNLVGLTSALLSTLVFVMQNVFTKKILSGNKGKQAQSSHEEHGMGGLGNKESISTGSASGTDPVDAALGGHHGPSQKLDKINILFYSATMAAICMIPMWLYTEGWHLMFSEDPLGHESGSTGTWTGISWLLFLNGVSHFFQNFLAFSVLALTSPVTYSIASLIKRIVVIVASIIYFHQTLGLTQWTGVCMTFWGLWMYNSAKNAAKIDPASSILASTKVGRRMSRRFGRGLLDPEAVGDGPNPRSKVGFMV
ncbi:suppressor of loss of ypt1 [Haplosporangium gracile]|nr:suppressor of loss of ypt1 [Haplosporangium gracile]